MTERKTLSICIAILFVVALGSIVPGGLALNRDLDDEDHNDLLLDGSVPMQGNLIVNNLLPAVTATYNLGIPQRKFNSVFAETINGTTTQNLVKTQSKEPNFLVSYLTGSTIDVSSVDATKFQGAPFLQAAGGAMTGDMDMNEFDITNVASINGRPISTLAVNNSAVGNQGSSAVFTITNNITQSFPIQDLVTLESQGIGMVASFNANKQLRSTGKEYADLVFVTNGAGATDEVAVFSGVSNTIKTSGVNYHDLIDNVNLYALKAGAVFTNNVHYGRSMVSTPCLFVGYKSPTSKVNGGATNQDNVMDLSTMTTIYNPGSLFTSHATGVAYAGSVVRKLNVTVLMTLENITVLALFRFFIAYASAFTGEARLQFFSSTAGTQQIAYTTSLTMTPSTSFIYTSHVVSAVPTVNVTTYEAVVIIEQA